MLWKGGVTSWLTAALTANFRGLSLNLSTLYSSSWGQSKTFTTHSHPHTDYWLSDTLTRPFGGARDQTRNPRVMRHPTTEPPQPPPTSLSSSIRTSETTAPRWLHSQKQHDANMSQIKSLNQDVVSQSHLVGNTFFMFSVNYLSMSCSKTQAAVIWRPIGGNDDLTCYWFPIHSRRLRNKKRDRSCIDCCFVRWGHQWMDVCLGMIHWRVVSWRKQHSSHGMIDFQWRERLICMEPAPFVSLGREPPVELSVRTYLASAHSSIDQSLWILRHDGWEKTLHCTCVARRRSVLLIAASCLHGRIIGSMFTQLINRSTEELLKLYCQVVWGWMEIHHQLPNTV